MSRSLKQIERELAASDGQLEWASKWEIGISFTSINDDGLGHIPNALAHAAWINLSDTGISDAVLARLNGCPRLESVSLGGTQVTASGLQQLLSSTPTIEQIELSVGQFDPKELAEIRQKRRDLVIEWQGQRKKFRL